MLGESYSGGTLNGLTVSNQYDADLRRTNLTLWNGTTKLSQTTYGYDHASRLASASDGTNTAAYSYLSNSSLPGQITFSAGGTTRMTTTKQYDVLNRLTSISSVPSGSAPISFNYSYNLANQRTQASLTDGS